ncbi:putative glycine dehydrogenase (decarboxylating) subunit 2 [Abditibacteriota bacterium]|nr:putative glycine dehydrogenase (decarboxylating) subunit 2 [Abditibacteriota bacterium]
MPNSLSLEPLLFELSDPGSASDYLPPLDVPEASLPFVVRPELDLPEVDEHSVVRHFTRLSQNTFSIDTHFYPLGSCTMKYNPKLNEAVAAMPGFAGVHPLQSEATSQGWLEVLFRAQEILAQIAGLDACSIQPLAGAQGEFCGLLMIRAYHNGRGEGEKRCRIVVPDSAHGTNPASAARCGYAVTTVKSNAEGGVDMDAMRTALKDDVAAVMITNPNTLGVFEAQIEELCALAHENGALVYMDGANMNAILGQARPGDMGVDVMHFNVHKTFSTPHGGGGPGAGPVAVRSILEPFLPVPHVKQHEGGEFGWDWDRPDAVGSLHGFRGNSGVILRALTYILRHGGNGLRQVSSDAVLSANYILARLKGVYETANPNGCKHECVLSASKLKAQYGVSAWDIAKRLPDYGFHAPTVYFPTIVKESMMIEPTETETKATLDAFCEAMLAIAEEAKTDPDLLHHAPLTMPVGRLDEANAAKCLNLCWTTPPAEAACESTGEPKREVAGAPTY